MPPSPQAAFGGGRLKRGRLAVTLPSVTQPQASPYFGTGKVRGSPSPSQDSPHPIPPPPALQAPQDGITLTLCKRGPNLPASLAPGELGTGARRDAGMETAAAQHRMLHRLCFPKQVINSHEALRITRQELGVMPYQPLGEKKTQKRPEGNFFLLHSLRAGKGGSSHESWRASSQGCLLPPLAPRPPPGASSPHQHQPE